MSGCQVCMCTETEPCILGDGTPCAWADPGHTICTGCIPQLEYLGELEGCEVYSPGTYGPDGWGPLDPLLRAAVQGAPGAPPRPMLVVSWGPGSKETRGEA